MLLRYEGEVCELLRVPGRPDEVFRLRVERGGTWRAVGEESRQLWDISVGEGDLQSLGATLCHVAAELRGEDPDSDPWNY